MKKKETSQLEEVGLKMAADAKKKSDARRMGEHSDYVLDEMDRIKHLLLEGIAIPELSIDPETGERSLRIYDLSKKVIFFTDIPWNIDYLTKDLGII